MQTLRLGEGVDVLVGVRVRVTRSGSLVETGTRQSVALKTCEVFSLIVLRALGLALLVVAATCAACGKIAPTLWDLAEQALGYEPEDGP